MSESDEYALRIGNSMAPVPLISHFTEIKWGNSPVRPDLEELAGKKPKWTNCVFIFQMHSRAYQPCLVLTSF